MGSYKLWWGGMGQKAAATPLGLHLAFFLLLRCPFTWGLVMPGSELGMSLLKGPACGSCFKDEGRRIAHHLHITHASQ